MTSTTNDVEPTTSATDELRRLLDERGVEHVDEKDGKFLLVTWSYNETSATFVEDTVSGETSIAISAIVSPEQAIAATLGASGTCIADETETISVRGDMLGNYYFDKHFTIHVMECSECGRTYEHVNGGYEFCPMCGRKVVDE